MSEAVADFFAMGGYAFYVWTSYGFFAIVMLWITLSPILKRRATLRDLSDKLAREVERSSES